MTETLNEMEVKIKKLLTLMDRLETENRAYRSMAQGGGESFSETEVASRIESLRLEKEKLEKKLDLVERTLDRVISEIDNPEL
jgi:seryl-tRNA synthetase